MARKHTASVTVEMMPDARVALDDRAAEAGLELASYIRQCLEECTKLSLGVTPRKRVTKDDKRRQKDA